MDTRSQIAEKVKELQEQNKLRAEQAEQAEREVAEGKYQSEPVVEQVRKENKPKKKKKKKKEVSVKNERPEPEADKPEDTNTVEPEPLQKEEGTTAKEKNKEALDDSLRNVESLLNKRERNPVREKGSITSDVAETPPKGTDSQRKSKYRGLHTTGRTRVKYVDLDGRPLKKFGLYDTSTGEVYTLYRDVMIVGKSQTANIVIENRYVSRRHLRITKENGEYYIEDLESKNGTKLNGELLLPGEKAQLEIGDTITLALTDVIFDVIK